MIKYLPLHSDLKEENIKKYSNEKNLSALKQEKTQ